MSDIENALRILKEHNEWRRDKNFPSELNMNSPTEIGWAIDIAICELSNSFSIDEKHTIETDIKHILKCIDLNADEIKIRKKILKKIN